MRADLQTVKADSDESSKLLYKNQQVMNFNTVSPIVSKNSKFIFESFDFGVKALRKFLYVFLGYISFICRKNTNFDLLNKELTI